MRPSLAAPAALALCSLMTAGLLAGGSAGVRSASAAPGDPVIAAAGDIACDPTVSNPDPQGADPQRCQQRATSDLLVGRQLAAVLALGDLQYEDGTAAKFQQAYDPTWGRVKGITRPVVGNHEYGSAGAAPYFDYFGGAAGPRGLGWYSYDIGSWHLVALNSNCTEVSCEVGSAQERWLRSDLAANPASCTLAYFHHPRFASDKSPRSAVRPLYQALQDAGTDVLLVGHEHNYERFARQDVDGRASASGIRQFVVGTGGKNFYVPSSRAANSEVLSATAHGALLLTLGNGDFSWQFAGTRGESVDSGSERCTANAPTSPAPTSPAPTSPAPTSPAPTSPAPTSPAPTSPAPTSPAPTSPAPTSPAPTSPAPADCVPPAVRLDPDPLTAGASAAVEVTGAPDTDVELHAYSRPSTTYRLVRRGRTDAGGKARFAVSPPTNTRLYAAHPSCPAGPSEVLDVRTTLSLAVQRLGRRDYVFSGDSLPARAGGLVVSLYRVTGTGGQVLTAQARAGAADGQWQLRRTFSGTGRFDFLVRTGQDLQNAPGASRARSLLVY